MVAELSFTYFSTLSTRLSARYGCERDEDLLEVEDEDSGLEGMLEYCEVWAKTFVFLGERK